MAKFRPPLPRSLSGRAALILIVPILTIQLVFSLQFIQRHYEGVTQQMARGLEIELSYLLDSYAADPEEAQRVAKALHIRLLAPAVWDFHEDHRDFWDVSGRALIATLRDGLPLTAVNLQHDNGEVRLLLDTPRGPVNVEVDRRRISASNPHQLLVLMIMTSILMTVIAFLFLSNQLRPIARLAQVAEAFGKGRTVPYRPRGALEVRAAGNAFLEMRHRIERFIEQRTLMLSGISHDLRTPLTRMKLELAMMDEDETADLRRDVQEMERLVDEFLAFTRGDATEEVVHADAAELARQVVTNAERMGQNVLQGPMDVHATVPLRPQAVKRALENLVGNAVRYGTVARVSLIGSPHHIRLVVEDDGPGIPKEMRDQALTPFARLGAERDPNQGGGVGLGLSIAADIARSHGGQLRLLESADLGGLRAEIVLAR
ncbi:ATP-binding protein [Falsirhodobacter sp. 20TX0035]|uniref:ATP-binding protein n=1 Tax=Falsirhodobacter sp. 20TX0035 TaxID=3022019 RepID=UPI00232D9A31|nr:ATP-binding protein [Falsirhodobacter sp. 20TX0035]MDB6453465.1 ATP-binding protein [Falsirhodobacter sp. 20TX0035]